MKGKFWGDCIYAANQKTIELTIETSEKQWQ